MDLNTQDERTNQENKIHKLKKMRFIATGLLILMSLIYIIFRRFESYGLVFSSIAAFSEAAMVGALADWFAVVAIFRHPLGISWIPHTAIIQKNKDKIGESLSGFVVSNFFTAEIIKAKLSKIMPLDYILAYIKDNKRIMSAKLAPYIPKIVELVLKNEMLSHITVDAIRSKLKDTDVFPIINRAAEHAISSGLHVSVIKQILEHIYKWAAENKEKTMKIIESINWKLSFPIVSDIVYKSILKMLSKLIDDIEKGIDSEFNREILHKLPARAIDDLNNSPEFQKNIEKLKSDFLDSDSYSILVCEKLSEIKHTIINYSINSSEEISSMLFDAIASMMNEILDDNLKREEINTRLKGVFINTISAYRSSIANLIQDTVDKWPMEDMVDKLETQVGGDLQYIRINGTIIGGLAGLIIHLITLLIK